MKVSARETMLRSVADVAGVPVEDLQAEQDIFDLGLDSVEFWAIVMDVEDAVGAPAPAGMFDRIASSETRLTIGDILAAAADWDTSIRA